MVVPMQTSPCASCDDRKWQLELCIVALLILCARVDGLSGVGVGVRWGGKVGVGRCVVVVVDRSSVLVVAKRVPVPVPVLVCILVSVPFLIFVHALLQVLTMECDGSSLLSYDALELRKLLLLRKRGKVGGQSVVLGVCLLIIFVLVEVLAFVDVVIVVGVGVFAGLIARFVLDLV